MERNVISSKATPTKGEVSEKTSTLPAPVSESELLEIARLRAEIESLRAEKEAAIASRGNSGPGNYGTKDIPRAMVGFTKWIAREYPGLGIALGENGRADDRTERLVTIASKAYRYFQSSDLNV